jgi:hypothetical protein
VDGLKEKKNGKLSEKPKGVGLGMNKEINRRQ